MLSGFFILISGTISYFCHNINFLFLLFLISILYSFFLYNNYYDNTIISEWLIKEKIVEMETIDDFPKDPLGLTLSNYTLTILAFTITVLIYFSYQSNNKDFYQV